jgi:hypothetical protein
MPVVGFLNAAIADHYKKFTNEFRRGLREMGFVEGQNVLVEYRWAQGYYERLPELAADLISRRSGHRCHQHARRAGGKKSDDDNSYCLHHWR